MNQTNDESTNRRFQMEETDFDRQKAVIIWARIELNKKHKGNQQKPDSYTRTKPNTILISTSISNRPQLD